MGPAPRTNVRLGLNSTVPALKVKLVSFSRVATRTAWPTSAYVNFGEKFRPSWSAFPLSFVSVRTYQMFFATLPVVEFPLI